MPQPLYTRQPVRKPMPSWYSLASRAWRTRHKHPSLTQAYQAQRSIATNTINRDYNQQQKKFQRAEDQWQARYSDALQAFRARHQNHYDQPT
jgi:hypothetical protein